MTQQNIFKYDINTPFECVDHTTKIASIYKTPTHQVELFQQMVQLTGSPIEIKLAKDKLNKRFPTLPNKRFSLYPPVNLFSIKKSSITHLLSRCAHHTVNQTALLALLRSQSNHIPGHQPHYPWVNLALRSS